MAPREEISFEHKEAREKLNKSNEDNDVLESVLYHVGEMGRYQMFLFWFMLPFGFFFAFVYFIQMFIAATPQNHWCHVPELSHLDPGIRRNLTAPRIGEEWDKCSMFVANWSQVLDTMRPPDPSTPTVPCQHGWDFELTDIPYQTIISERGWVCQYSGNGPLAQAIFFVGAFFGGIVIGWIADTYGRVPAMVVANSLAFVGGIATIYTTGFWDFAMARFVVGASYDSVFMMMYILVLEYVGPSYRTLVGNLPIAIFFGGACVLLPWIALWISDWRKLLWVTTLPMVINVLVPFLVPESARWYTSKGRTDKAIKVLKRFEKINGTIIPQDILDEFKVSSNPTRQSNESIMSLFKSGPIRTMLIYMVVLYMACAIIFDALVRMSEGLGIDFFITFTLTSFTEIPSIVLLAFVLDRWGRRNMAFVPISISGSLTLIAAFVPKGIPQTALAVIARFFINMSYSAAIQWSTEILPTGVRGTGSSLIHVSGYVACILSPFVVYSERVWSPLPLVILSAVAAAAAGVSLLIPETNGRPMPQTIEDGERLFREYSLCGKPEDLGDAELQYEKRPALDT
ncbi:solute carrier family 22 member 3-like [Epargyreus clarus]|uniref:solute carrier family 22 member 3-like n=1 Tax=Epargyreus clarus TaxID=520877 RepID=UPI003C2F93E7